MVKKVVAIILVICSLFTIAGCSFGTGKSSKEDRIGNAMRNYLIKKYEFEEITVENIETVRSKKYGEFTVKEFSHGTFTVDEKTYTVVAYALDTKDSYIADDFEKEIITNDIKKYFEKSFKDDYEYFNIDYYKKMFMQIKEYEMSEDFPDEWFSGVISEKYTGDVGDFFAAHKWKEKGNLDGLFLNITVGFVNAKTINYNIDKDIDNLWVSYMNILNFKDKNSLINKNFRIAENLAYIYPNITEFYTIGDYSNNPTVNINGYQKISMKSNQFCSYVNLTNPLYVCNQNDININEKGTVNVPCDNEATTLYYIPIENISNFNWKNKYEVSYVLNENNKNSEMVRVDVDIEENLKHNNQYIMVEGIGESDNNNLHWYLIEKQ